MEVVAETSLIDIVKEGYDAGVRWGENLAQDMIAVPLSPPQRFVVVAAPDLAAACGLPAEPHDLLRYPCIRQRFPSGATPAWEFERGGTIVRLDPPARRSEEHTSELQSLMRISYAVFCLKQKKH